MSRFARPRGTRDFGPAEMATRRWLEASLRESARRFGFGEVATPIFEHTDLFRAKSGPNVIDEIYAFQDKGERDICLRPELTAPVMRFYLEALTREPKPLKFFYYGPCYRYEEPQEGRYREFWQFGTELIGPSGPDADAEVIALAHACIAQTGLRDFILHVGHIGLLRALVARLEASDADKATTFRLIDKDSPELRDHLAKLGASDALAEAIIGIAHHEASIDLRDATAIADYLDTARALLSNALAGDAEAADHAEAALVAFGRTLRLVGARGVATCHADLGVARGLDYYTGIVFELEAPQLGAQKQIGGGGAYTLAEVFGGQPTGSAGFGLGFDRILLALEREDRVPTPRVAVDVAFATIGDEAAIRAVELATALRADGLAVATDLMGRNVKKALQHAGKLGARLVVIAGDKELADGVVTLRDMATAEQMSVAVDSLLAEVQKRLAA